MKKRFYRTDFLFPKASFWLGVGSIFSLFGSFYTFNCSETGQEADRTAIESDFGTIGGDISKIMTQYEF